MSPANRRYSIASQRGVDILDHVDQLDEECIEHIVDNEVFVCPSVYLLKAILETVRAQDDGAIEQPFFEDHAERLR